jgi:hypothetical protein
VHLILESSESASNLGLCGNCRPVFINTALQRGGHRKIQTGNRLNGFAGPLCQHTGLKSGVNERNSARELRISRVMIEQTQTKMPEIDPEHLTRLLELELVQKRATWKQTSERARSIRAAGFVFLFFLIVACLVGGYFAFTRMSEQRQNHPPSATADR